MDRATFYKGAFTQLRAVKPSRYVGFTTTYVDEFPIYVYVSTNGELCSDRGTLYGGVPADKNVLSLCNFEDIELVGI